MCTVVTASSHARIAVEFSDEVLFKFFFFQFNYMFKLKFVYLSFHIQKLCIIFIVFHIVIIANRDYFS
jgi:hypothetical protein